MAIYIFTWVFFSIGSLIEVNTMQISKLKDLNRIILFSSFALLVYLVGFRYETATDWFAYLHYFESQILLDFFDDIGKFEFGYVYLTRITILFSNNYQFFLVLHAFIFFILLFKAYKFFTPFTVVAVFLYFAINVGMTGSNRQLLAVTIGLIGLKYLYQGRTIIYFLCVALAVSFHNTGLLLLIYYFINRKFNPKVLFVIIAAAILVGYSSLPRTLFQLASGLSEVADNKVDAYLDLASEDNGEGSIIGIVKRLVLSIIFIVFSRRIGDKNHKYFLCLNGYLVGIIFFFLFKSVPIMAGRAILYFNIMEPILMSYMLYLFRDYATKNIVILLYCLICIFYFFQSINLYPEIFIPYKGLFINENYDRGMF